MVDETAALLDRWSRHATHGINALAPEIPRFQLGADGVLLTTEWPAPPIVTLYVDTEETGVAERLDPPQLPAWLTWGEGQPIEAESKEARGTVRGYIVTIGTAYVTEQDVDAATETRNAGLFLRANRISFQRFNHENLSAAFREYNDIRIFRLSHKMSQKAPGIAVGASRLWGFNVTEAFVSDRLK